MTKPPMIVNGQDMNVLLTRNPEPIVNLVRMMKLGECLEACSNAQLATLLLHHVYGPMPVIDPRSELLSEICDRLGLPPTEA